MLTFGLSIVVVWNVYGGKFENEERRRRLYLINQLFHSCMWKLDDYRICYRIISHPRKLCLLSEDNHIYTFVK